MKNKKNIIKRYKIRKSSIGIIVTLILVCVGIYFFLSYYDNHFAIETLLSNDKTNDIGYQRTIAMIRAGKDVLLAITSILITAVLTIIIIDVKENNNMVTDLLSKDIFGSEAFYNLLSVRKKKQILNMLEQEIYFSDNVMLEPMYEHCKETLKEGKFPYFYTFCKLDIVCNVYGDYIEKSIFKTIRMKSCDENYMLNNYVLSSCSYQKMDGNIKQFEVENIWIDDNEVDLEKYEIKPSKENRKRWDERRGYNERQVCTYKDSIMLSREKEIEIKTRTISRVPRHDYLYSCRLPVPCEKFELKYTVENNRNFLLNTIAFGFIDDATKTPNNSGKNPSIDVSFDNWVYPRDGVVIALCEKN